MCATRRSCASWACRLLGQRLDQRARSRETLGALNQPVVFAGELIRPGDIVKGDADGIVVVRREEVREAAELSAARDAHEAELITKYWAGGTTIELCNLTEVLKAKGLTSDIEDAS